MRNLALVLLLVAGALPMARAQSSLQWEQGTIALNSGWRTHSGDLPGWAAPGFDDSSWTLTALGETNATGRGAMGEQRWYRRRIDLPPSHPPLALLVTGGNGTWEIFVNGQRLSGAALRPSWGITWPKAQALPFDGSGPIILALRTRIPNSSVFRPDFGAIRVSLGTRPAIESAARAEQSGRLNQVAIGAGINLLLIFAALPLLLLSRLQRNHREYLWIGLNILLTAFGTLLYGLAMFSFVPFSLNEFIADPALYLTTIAQIEFTFSFTGRPITRLWRAYEVVLLLPPLMLPWVWPGVVDRGVYNVVEILCILPISVLLPVLLLVWYRRGNREAGWLILPSVLPLLTICLNDVGIVGGYLGSPRLTAVGSPITLGSLAVQPFDLADLLFLISIGIVIFLRFNRVSREQARTATELEAAQRVQTLLLRSAHTDETRFRMSTVYRPAAEVGGDFFHAAEIDGYTRIVVGDVSGKGLGAAMMVSALIGALDGNRSTDPAALLAQLNELLLARQQDGFVTCLCACIRPDACVTVANAGHLSPYRNGEEIDINSGLPLGIAPGVDYTGTLLQLDADDLLTFVSDGVIEARNHSGELFGFERTRAISLLSADQIAETAQAFGQQDDITVLTLRYTPSAALRV